MYVYMRFNEGSFGMVCRIGWRIVLTATAVCLMAMTLPAGAEITNTGEDREFIFNGHDMPPPGIGRAGTGEIILYAPSEDDNATFRAAVVSAGAGACDYFDARAATPTLAQLAAYDAVYTWTNYSYADENAFGDVLADYVDAGGVVILGTWAYPGGWNGLGGRVVTSGYIPVSYTSVSSGGADYNLDGSECIFSGVDAYSLTYFASDPTPMGGGILDGTLTGGVAAAAYRPDYQVIFVNGTADYSSGDFPELIATAASCGVRNAVAPRVPATSGVGTTVLILLVAVAGGLLISRRIG